MPWLPFYYDDDTIESYKLTTTGSAASKSSISSTGFYPRDKAEALVFCVSYYFSGQTEYSVATPIYTPGFHETSYVSNCSLPKVTKARFDTIRSRAHSVR